MEMKLISAGNGNWNGNFYMGITLEEWKSKISFHGPLVLFSAKTVCCSYATGAGWVALACVHVA